MSVKAEPEPPFSTTTAMAITGASAGAYHTNTPVLTEEVSDWVVPVLAATGIG